MRVVHIEVYTILELKAQFPGLAGGWHYLDTAATAQKPQAVIDATVRAMGSDYATVHRGVYARSAEMTLAYEAARPTRRTTVTESATSSSGTTRWPRSTSRSVRASGRSGTSTARRRVPKCCA